MELGCLPAAERKRRRHLSRLDVRRLQNDHRAVAQRVGDCLLLGALVGVLRTVPNKVLAGFATAYVEMFRNVPLLVQLFIWYFVLPELLPASIGDAYKQSNPVMQQFLASMVCLGLFTSARVAEQVRAGINSLPRARRTPVWRSASRCRRPTAS
jgi:His/Glu/Gln/Arg/opine family amino acid ABC transporter permease subunit